MRRIYVEIYLSVVATALMVAVGMALFGHWYFEGRLEADLEALRVRGAEILSELPVGARPGALEAALERATAAEQLTAVLWSADGERLADARPGRGSRSRDVDRDGERPPEPRMRRSEPGEPGLQRAAHSREHRRRHKPPPWAWVSVTNDAGLSLELASNALRRRPERSPWLFAALFLGSIAIGAYPVSRRISGGLERLREGVNELGSGDLSARVEIEGQNEVADVARAFNTAAERIQRGVEAQRRVLASASHELRSPLGRLRAALELIAEGRSEHLEEAERDIDELDALIGDLLLAARLDATRVERERVDLDAIVRAEAERVGARVSGHAPAITGDARTLRRMVRNLLDNALRHGAPPIELTLSHDQAGDSATLRVRDAGGGVAAAERGRIFEPFYRPAGHSEGRDGGVGLGLALVAEIAAHHGGSARCEEDATSGSAFVIELPVDARD